MDRGLPAVDSEWYTLTLDMEVVILIENYSEILRL
jgi:hypothetical protein